jgi:enoyl-CoA hydratase/carnithine racemase
MITADEALAWDMVSELVPPEKLRAHVQAYADDLASKSPAALAAIRRTITLGGGMDYEAGLAFEKEAVGQVASGPDSTKASTLSWRSVRPGGISGADSRT